MIRLIIITYLFLIFVSCNTLSDKQSLKATIRNDTTLILKKLDRQGNVWGIDLTISGDFRDTIKLIHSNGDNVAYSYSFIGKTDTSYNTDWYSDSCLIQFRNVYETVNNIQLTYEFYD